MIAGRHRAVDDDPVGIAADRPASRRAPFDFQDPAERRAFVTDRHDDLPLALPVHQNRRKNIIPLGCLQARHERMQRCFRNFADGARMIAVSRRDAERIAKIVERADLAHVPAC